MKSGIVILVFCFCTNGIIAQSLKEKIGNKISSVVSKDKGSKGKLESTESIKVIAKKWDEKNKKISYRPSGSSGTLKATKYHYVNFIKDSVGNVAEIHMGEHADNDGNIKHPKVHTPWDYEASDFTEAYFMTAMHVIYLTEKSIVSYTLDGDKRVKAINRVLGDKGKNAKTWIAEIQAYRDYRDERVAADREARKQEEIANRAKYTLEGKSVTDIKIVFVGGEQPKYAKANEMLTFGLEVTLADGSKDKTHNIGGNLYMEDFKTSYDGLFSGIGSNYSVSKWGEHCHCINANIHFNGATKPGEKDFVIINAESKFGGSGKAEFKLPILYARNDEFNFGGGSTVRAYVKTVKHSETGEDLYHCKINDQYVKIRPGGTLTISAAGGVGNNGRDGQDKWSNDVGAPGDGTNGGRGGDGGTVYLTKDPNVGSNFNFEGNVLGGSGGDGGSYGHCFSCVYGSDGKRGKGGPAGSNGTIVEKTGKVSF